LPRTFDNIWKLVFLVDKFAICVNLADDRDVFDKEAVWRLTRSTRITIITTTRPR